MGCRKKQLFSFVLLEHMVTFDAAKTGLFNVHVMMGRKGLLVAFLAIGFMELVHLIERRQDMRHFLSTKPAWVRWPVYYGVGFAIAFFGIFAEQQFIYFQF